MPYILQVQGLRYNVRVVVDAGDVALKQFAMDERLKRVEERIDRLEAVDGKIEKLLGRQRLVIRELRGMRRQVTLLEDREVARMRDPELIEEPGAPQEEIPPPADSGTTSIALQWRTSPSLRRALVGAGLAGGGGVLGYLLDLLSRYLSAG